MFRKSVVLTAISVLTCAWAGLVPAQRPASVAPQKTDLHWRLSTMAQPAAPPTLPAPAQPPVAAPAELMQLPAEPMVLPAGAAEGQAAAALSLRPTADVVAQADPSQAVAIKDVGLDSQVPSLRVLTGGPDTVIVGKPANYLVTLTNEGDVAAREITVQISLPSWVELQATKATAGAVHQQNGSTNNGQLVWSIEEAAGKTQETLSLILVPQQGRGFDLTVDWSVRPTSSKRQITVKEPKLQLDLAGPDDFVFGETATWTVSMTNPGTGDAHEVNLKVYSDADEIGALDIGTIQAGTRRTVDCRFRPAKAGSGRVRAVAVAERGLEADAGRDYLVRRPDLQVELLGSMFEYAGNKIEYPVRIINTGNADAKEVNAVLSFPEGVQYVSGLKDAQVSPAGVTWNVACIKPGAESSARILCDLQGPGEHEFVVNVSAPEDLVATDSIVTRVEATADLKLDVLDPQGPRPVDEPTQYEIHLTNRGTDTARLIQVVAVCPPEVEAVDVTGSAAIESGQIFFRPISEIGPGQKVVHKVTVRSRKAGSHMFRVVVQCEKPETRLALEETTRFFVRPTIQAMAAPAFRAGSR